MCNTCGCKAAEETKYRSPSKKQLRQEEAAIKDVDYMREKFQAMEVFPAGQHDIDAAREALENMYSGIEIDDIIYMTKKTGNKIRHKALERRKQRIRNQVKEEQILRNQEW